MGEGLEVLTPAEMGRADAEAAAMGAPTRVLMEKAGRAVANAAAAGGPRPAVVLCGPGANGGDGYVAARLLRLRGWPVRVAALAPREAMKGDAADAAAAWEGAVEPLTGRAVHAGDLVIDALFGAGLSGPLRAVTAELAEASPAWDVLAVDTPSGLPGDGRAPDGTVFQARRTVTFARLKPGHLLLPGRFLCGEAIVADIGIPDAAIERQGAALWRNSPALWLGRFPQLWLRQGRDVHKHARGHAMVASGGAWSSGAARLAARAALRAGAGLVTVLSPAAAGPANAAQLTAVMLAPAETPRELASRAQTAAACVIGPGFGLDRDVQGAVLALAALARPLVLDADALTGFADAPERLFAATHPACVLTPHVGEFRRLFPDIAESAVSKIEKARAAARRAGCVVLLKGADTVVADPAGRAAVNETGTPYMATAGSGDVLAGVIAGLLAQGMPAWEAACAAAWLHGMAGEAAGPGLIAEDLCDAIPRALRRLQG